MPSYRVSYMTPRGQRVNRIYDAVDAESMRSQFTGKFITALKIEAHDGHRFNPATLKVPIDMLIANLDVIEVLLDSGIPLQIALRKLVEGLPSGPIRFLWSGIASDIEGSVGELSSAFGRFPKVFPDAVVGMIQSGATSGRLSEGIHEARNYIESMHELRKLAVGAMIYPAVIMAFAVGVFFLLMFFTIPTFQKMLMDFMAGAGADKKLPLLTQIFFGTSNALTGHPVLTIGGAVASIAGAVAIVRVNALRKTWYRFWMVMPFVKDVLWALATARFASNFASCYQATGQAMQALEASRLVVGNPVIIDLIDRVRAEIQNGRRFGEALRTVGGFPVPLVVAVENSEADLARVLKRMGVFYAAEAKRTIAGCMKLIEPALTVCVILFTALAMLALFMPLIEIMRNIK